MITAPWTFSTPSTKWKTACSGKKSGRRIEFPSPALRISIDSWLNLRQEIAPGGHADFEMSRLYSEKNFDPAEAKLQVKRYDDILEAIEKRDSVKANKLMPKHLVMAEKRFLNHLKKKDESEANYD
jgi:hypothetical protein